MCQSQLECLFEKLLYGTSSGRCFRLSCCFHITTDEHEDNHEYGVDNHRSKSTMIDCA